MGCNTQALPERVALESVGGFSAVEKTSGAMVLSRDH